MASGHDFDFTSDRLLESLQVVDGRLVAPGTSYRALVVSGCRLMPAETLERIVKLAGDGATVILHGPLPADVPGLGQLAQRRTRFRAALARIELAKNAADASGTARIDKGRIVFSDNLTAAMAHYGVRRETMTDSGCAISVARTTRELPISLPTPPETNRSTGGCRWPPTAKQRRFLIP